MRRVTLSALALVALVATGCAPLVAPDGSDAPGEPTAPPTPTPSATATRTPEPSPTASATPEPVVTVSPPEPTPEPEPTQAAAEPAPPAPQEPSTPTGLDITTATSLQVLVNKRAPLSPADYRPQLVRVATAQDGDELVRPELDAALMQLDAAMRAEIGVGTHVFSSYRSYARQTQLYNGYVARYGQASADTTSARAGHSEHQTGLAVDVMGTDGACRLSTCFGDTAAGRWIAANAWQHGFLVRYPRGLEGITGYHWEPWHLRYVGSEVSTAMHEGGIATYEEFLATGAAPDYG